MIYFLIMLIIFLKNISINELNILRIVINMAIYAISDLHLSVSGEKPMDVFDGWDNYVDKLKHNWQNTVLSSDTVVIAGDISWAMKLEESIDDFKFIDLLPGKKIILKGNHDYWWSTVNKVKNFFEANAINSISILHNSSIEVEGICICGTRGWLYNSGTDNDMKILSREAGRLTRSIDIAFKMGFEPIVFLHYPPVYGNSESEEIINILVERNIKKCYYGHIHGGRFSNKLVTGQYKGVELSLISCDYLNFCPKFVY